MSIVRQLRFSASPVNRSRQPFHSISSTIDVLFDALSIESSVDAEFAWRMSMQVVERPGIDAARRLRELEVAGGRPVEVVEVEDLVVTDPQARRQRLEPPVVVGGVLLGRPEREPWRLVDGWRPAQVGRPVDVVDVLRVGQLSRR